jgi:hypothetical protein
MPIEKPRFNDDEKPGFRRIAKKFSSAGSLGEKFTHVVREIKLDKNDETGYAVEEKSPRAGGVVQRFLHGIHRGTEWKTDSVLYEPLSSEERDRVMDALRERGIYFKPEEFKAARKMKARKKPSKP